MVALAEAAYEKSDDESLKRQQTDHLLSEALIWAMMYMPRLTPLVNALNEDENLTAARSDPLVLWYLSRFKSEPAAARDDEATDFWKLVASLQLTDQTSDMPVIPAPEHLSRRPLWISPLRSARYGSLAELLSERVADPRSQQVADSTFYSHVLSTHHFEQSYVLDSHTDRLMTVDHRADSFRLLDEARRLAQRIETDGIDAAAFVTRLVPIVHNRTQGITLERTPGAVYLETSASVGELIDRFIHEASHNKLDAINEQEPLAVKTDELVVCAWREDPRPPIGVLHGCYVLTNVADAM